MAWPPSAATAQRDEIAANAVAIYETWQKAQDPEQRIALGEQLLALEPKLKAWPPAKDRTRVKGEVLFGLGLAYASRSQGVRADNIEKCIDSYQAALAIAPGEPTLSQAEIHHNLGVAYLARIRGEQSANLEEAIAHFETALGQQPSGSRASAITNATLANAYLMRPKGVRAENIDKAISQLENALLVLTRQSAPDAWAIAQATLASSYIARESGDRADNIEKAIAALEAAQTVFTREANPVQWAALQVNLAGVYGSRLNGDPHENEDKALTILQGALLVFTRETAPQEWATTQRGIARTLAVRKGNDPGNLSRAVTAYEAALTVLSRDADPLTHMQVAHEFSRVLMRRHDWQRAGEVLASAREAFTISIGSGLDANETRSLVAKAGTLFEDAAYAALQRHDNENALLLASEGRGRLLSLSLKIHDLGLPDAGKRRLQELRDAIRTQEALADTATGPERLAALEKLAAQRRDLLAIVQSASGGPAGASPLDHARQLVREGSVIAMPVITAFGSKLLLMSASGDATETAVVDLPELTSERLGHLLAHPDASRPLKNGGWFADYFINYMDDAEREQRFPEWLAAIDNIGPQLWQLFAARLDTALKQRGVKPGTRLVWMPTGWLAVFPLGLAQDPISKRRLATDYEIAYAPSLDTLAASHRHIATPRPATLVAVINPTGDLPGTEAEGDVVASHFPDGARTLLAREAATGPAVLAALKGKSYWHFASHGTFSWADASDSAVIMHGPTRLSIGELLKAGDLGQPRLVVLSACETGLYDVTKSPDEFIGLPGSFIALGAAGVLGTLWPVDDAATALLIAKFYDLHMNEKLAPSTALSRAQAWLIQAKETELEAYASRAASENRLQPRHLAAIQADLVTKRAPGPILAPAAGNTPPNADPSSSPTSGLYPYAHPYYWGGFIYTGL